MRLYLWDYNASKAITNPTNSFDLAFSHILYSLLPVGLFAWVRSLSPRSGCFIDTLQQTSEVIPTGYSSITAILLIEINYRIVRIW
jgi:hypothetical protein